MSKRNHKPPPTPHRRAGPRGAKPKPKAKPLPWEKRNAAKLAPKPTAIKRPKVVEPLADGAIAEGMQRTARKDGTKTKAELAKEERKAATEKVKKQAEKKVAKAVEKAIGASKSTFKALVSIADDVEATTAKIDELKPQIAEAKAFIADCESKISAAAHEDGPSKQEESEEWQKAKKLQVLADAKKARLSNLTAEMTGEKEERKGLIASMFKLIRDADQGRILFDQPTMPPAEEAKPSDEKPAKSTRVGETVMEAEPSGAGPVANNLKEALGEASLPDAGDVAAIPGAADFQIAALHRAGFKTIGELREHAKAMTAKRGEHKGKLPDDWLASIKVEGVGPALQRLIEDALQIRTPQYKVIGSKPPELVTA